MLSRGLRCLRQVPLALHLHGRRSWLPAGPAGPLLQKFSMQVHPPQALRTALSLLTLSLSHLVARAWRPLPCFRLRRNARVWPHHCWLL